MRSALVLVLALVAAMVATPALAEDGSVPQATLNSLGLAGMDVMSDAEGNEIRGRITGNGMVIGTSLISFQLVTPDTKNFINGSSINMVSGDAQFGDTGEQLTKSHAVAVGTELDGPVPLTLNVTVTGGTPATVNYTYAGSVIGQVGGVGFINLDTVP